MEWSWGYESTDIEIVGVYDEPDDEYQLRLDWHTKCQKEYDAWYKENKTAVDKELKRRADKKKQQKKDKIAKLEKQLKELKSK